ncbi:MAG: ExbD/TolR family protein [Pirellulaceae bacterium]
MRLSKRRRPTKAQMNMTPMIDVVFLLLIFFMTVSQVSEINRERLELPRQQGSDDQKPAVLTINVNQSGQLIIGGTIYPLADLISLVADELARLGDDPSRLTVVLRADRRAASAIVNRTVNALARLDIRNVRIPVQVPD